MNPSNPAGTSQTPHISVVTEEQNRAVSFSFAANSETSSADLCPLTSQSLLSPSLAMSYSTRRYFKCLTSCSLQHPLFILVTVLLFSDDVTDRSTINVFKLLWVP